MINFVLMCALLNGVDNSLNVLTTKETINPTIVTTQKPNAQQEAKFKELGTYFITAYCEGNINAAGKRPTIGTIAAPREIPLGTKVMINGVIYTVEDRTHKRFDKGLKSPKSRFDIYMGDGEFEKSFQWGKRKLKVYILDQ